MKRKLRFRVLAVCLIVGSYHALAATHYVSLASPAPRTPYASWSTAATNIQDAVDVAAPGDVVFVAAGVYAQGSMATPNTAPATSLGNRVVIGSRINVISTGGPAVTVIAGAGPCTNWAVRCVYLTNAFLGGFTLSNGYTRDVGEWRYDCSGGGVLNLDGVVSNCVIINCAAYYYGGGAAGVAVADNAVVCGVFHNCTFRNNSARYGGGGASWCDLHACRVVSNKSDTWGGGLNESAACNTLVVSNAALFGGGSFLSVLTNCTVVCNDALEGGGTYWDYVVNSIVKGNRAMQATDYRECDFAYSCSTPLPVGGAGNIDANPNCVNAANDFRLAYPSACINAGNTLAVQGLTDLAGRARIIDGIVDMGAYESDPNDIRPFLDITNANATVAYGATVCTIGGTNNAHVVGSMSWSNLLTRASGILPSAPGWIIPGITLAVGSNPIMVIGTNVVGNACSDQVTITRSPEPLPLIDVTNATRTLPAGTTSTMIGGTNLNIAVGRLWWWNDRDPRVITPFNANGPDAWFTAMIVNLQPGTNIVTVSGTNAYGWAASDTITIIVDWPRPAVVITNAVTAVPFHLDRSVISGTNDNVVGMMAWQRNTGASNWFGRTGLAWATTAIGLEHGWNTITVYGTNAWRMWARDTVRVYRQMTNDVLPLVDITNATRTLSAGTTSAMIGGTNLNIAAGRLWWWNDRDPLVITPFNANDPDAWFTAMIVNLQPGTNIVTVSGTNAYGWAASDAVTIIVDWPRPALVITNAVTSVPFHLDRSVISGTNDNVVGMMAWQRNTGASNWFGRTGLAWATTAIGLEHGWNTITVYGTNAWRMWARDTVRVYRQMTNDVLPLVDITNATRTLSAGTTSTMIGGTNLNIAVGRLWWWNDRDPLVITPFNANGPGAWFTAMIVNLQPGTNIVTVSGTNAYGWAASDAVTIIVDWPRPALVITNAVTSVPFHLDRSVISGTNDNVVGMMAWQRNTGASNWFGRTGLAWATTAIGLEHGWNTITVYGTNAWRMWARDTVRVYRQTTNDVLPLVAITNAEQRLTYDAERSASFGGINSNIVGTLTWWNERDGVIHHLMPSAPDGWFADRVENLQTGVNMIIVVGTNHYGWCAGDTNTIYVEPVPRPFVDITNAARQVVNVPWVEVCGTNGRGTHLVCCVNERTGRRQQPFAWGDVVANMVEGLQRLVVYGTNILGFWTSDWHEVTYHILRPDVEIVGSAGVITNGGMYDFGVVLTGMTHTAELWVCNPGDAPLTCQPMIVEGRDCAVAMQPQTLIAPGASSLCEIVFMPVSTNVLVGTGILTNNVTGKNPYIVYLTGTPVPSHNHAWYSLVHAGDGIRCNFQYNGIGNPTPCRDDICLQINNTECLEMPELMLPYFWHFRRSSGCYTFRGKIRSSGRVTVMLDTRRQRGSIFVKKFSLPCCSEAYLPVHLKLGAFHSAEVPYFAGTTKGARTHKDSMGYLSNIFVVTSAQVRYRKNTPKDDDVLLLKGRCMTNPEITLPTTFAATLTWGLCRSPHKNIFNLSMKRGADNVFCNIATNGVIARIDFVRGRWQLKASNCDLEQARNPGPIVLEAALKIGDNPVVFQEIVNYTATVRDNKNRTIIY